MDTRATGVIERALAGQAPNYNEVVYLLKLDEASPEATAVRGAANDIVRAKTKNSGIMYGQIGVDVYPCEADCKFCSFGKSSTHFTEHTTMPLDEVVERARAFTQGDDLYGLWIMTMNSYDENYFVEVVKAVRAAIPDNVVLFSNIGGTDVAYFKRLKEADSITPTTLSASARASSPPSPPSVVRRPSMPPSKRTCASRIASSPSEPSTPLRNWRTICSKLSRRAARTPAS